MRALVEVASGSGGVRPFTIKLERRDGILEVASGSFGPLAPPADLARRFERSKLEPGDVKAFGSYLFQSLLGDTWGEVTAAAAADGESAIELALSWPSADHELHRLPWETMHDGNVFLGAHPDFSVAVTRIVADAPEADCPQPVMAPVRVLFVLGAELDDPRIKAGAEVIGLIRGVERGRGAINHSILEDATLVKLEERCRQFEPHIVHFVSHGALDASGRGELQLRSGESDETGWASGERLLRALGEAERAPLLVVLTGCESAAAGDHMDSLAAELVQGGIPSVIGMAGRISDPVCRLFSREFGRALNTGLPLVEAMTEGRRAGLQRQEERAADDNAWALPSIYLAPCVPAGHAPVDAVGASAAFARIEQFKLGEGPIFCGHTQLLEQFDCLFDPGEPLNALVAFSRGEEKVGRTRLLHELAARALRAGHVVVMVDDRRRDPSLLPQTPLQLAVALTRSLIETSQRFGLEARPPRALLGLLEEATGVTFAPDPAEGVLSTSRTKARLVRCEDAETVDEDLLVAALRDALSEDLERLAEQAREDEEAALPGHARVLVVLGGLGHWGSALELLLEEMVDANGLGSRQSPVPVLASCSLADPGGKYIEQAMQAARGSQWIAFEELKRLGENEETLACQWVLLHPWRSDVEGSETAYAPAAEAPEDAPAWEVPFKRLVKRLPGNLGHPFFYEVALMQAEHEVLVAADDDAVLRAYAATASGEER